jgi:hypothetical protein
MANCYLTHEQRTELLDYFCAKLDKIDPSFPMDELIENMSVMNNGEFYNECVQFIPEQLSKV